MNKRDEVFEAINEERSYQQSKWNENVTDSGGLHTLPEWLLYVESYVNEAKHVYSRFPNPQGRVFCQHALRKIAALAVAALEDHGVVTRAEEGPRPIGYTGPIMDKP